MAVEQIDLDWSRLRVFGYWIFSCVAFVYSTSIIYEQMKVDHHKFMPGSFAEFILWCSPFLFGFGIIKLFPQMLRSGVAVSVGPKGVFDRRLSSDWIPWDAMQSVRECKMNRQVWLILQIDPAREQSLPLHEKAKAAANHPIQFGPRGYYLAGTSLKGGSKALIAAIRHFSPKHVVS